MSVPASLKPIPLSSIPAMIPSPAPARCSSAAQGNQRFSQLCQELDVRFHRTGSLMVCFGEQGAEVLRHKYRNGLAMEYQVCACSPEQKCWSWSLI